MECTSFMRVACILMSFHSIFCLPKPKKPVCVSHSGLCDVSFEITESNSLTGPIKYTSSSEICECPGKVTCPRNSADQSQVIYQEMTSPGQSITTRLSYCNPRTIPSRDCNQNEVAVTLRGVGPIITEIVGEMACKCAGPVVLHRAYPDGMYSIREYTCGKPDCNINSSKTPVCERVSHTLSMFGFSTESEIPCSCPEGFVCNTNKPMTLGGMFGQATEFHCEIESV